MDINKNSMNIIYEQDQYDTNYHLWKHVYKEHLLNIFSITYRNTGIQNIEKNFENLCKMLFKKSNGYISRYV